MPLAPGTRLGPYEVLSPIGAGGMGEVYRAQDPRIGREVAIKVISPDKETDPDQVRRFEGEARAAGALNHPNVLTVFDVGNDRGSPYVVFELLEGQTVRQWLASPSLPVRKVLDYATQIARGLAAAHEKGIVHRDLKPENLFVTKAGQVKILDFGLAKLHSRGRLGGEVHPEGLTLSEATHPGTVLGTVGYMSPEQVRGKATDPRSDVFSFGAILYEMLSGQRAFKGGSSAETLSAILKEEPPELSGIRSDVPPALDRILRRCLEKKPDERFRTAHDLAFALEAVSGVASPTPPPATPDRRTAAVRWLVAGVVALAAIVTVAIGLRSRVGSAPSRDPAPGIRVEKLTNRGNVDDAAISPDGRYLAYRVREEKGQAIWLRDLVEKTETRLADLPLDAGIVRFAKDGQAVYLMEMKRKTGLWNLYRVPLIGGEPRLVSAQAWPNRLSPDDKRVAFTRSRDGKDRLFVADVEGGLEQEVADIGVEDASWSPDGSQLLFRSGKEGKDTLVVVRADGTGERTVFEAPGKLGRAWWKPRGDGILYLQVLKDRDARFFALDFVAGLAKPVGDTVFVDQIEAPLWLPDGSKFVLEGHVKGEGHGLWLVSYPDGRTERFPADPHDYWSPGMTANGAQMVSVQSVRRSEILVSTDPGKGSFVKIMGGTGIAQELPWTYRGTDYRLGWTADGRIVYTSNEGGSYDLYLCRADGSGRTQLTRDRTSNEIEPAGSPDGRYIVFVSDREGGGLFRINLDGTGLLRLTTARPDDHPDRDPRVTPDSRWVLYRQWDNGTTVWKVPIDGGTPVLIKGVRPAPPGGVVDEAMGAAASPDGKSLAFFYFTMEGPKFSPVDLVVSSFDGRILKRFPYRDINLGGFHPDEHVQWSKDGSELYYNYAEVGDLWRQPLAGGSRVRVAHLDEPPSYCDWSFDNKAIACNRNSTISDVVLISNFH